MRCGDDYEMFKKFEKSTLSEIIPFFGAA